MDVHPAPIHRQGVHAGQADTMEIHPDRMPPVMLAPPVGSGEKMEQIVEHLPLLKEGLSAED
jgi:hypothetical protein